MNFNDLCDSRQEIGDMWFQNHNNQDETLGCDGNGPFSANLRICSSKWVECLIIAYCQVVTLF